MHDETLHGESHEPETGAAPDPNAVIEQVRELLFGEHRRATDAALKSLDDRLAALTATLEARFGDLGTRVDALKAESQATHGHHAEALGASLVELGERIRALVAKPAPAPSEPSA